MSHTSPHSSIAKAFSSAANSYEDNAALQVQVGEWLLQELVVAEYYLDVGCGRGYMAQQLKRHGLAARVTGLDCAWQMLAEPGTAVCADSLVCADMADLPFVAQSFDAVTANLALQWAAQPESVLKGLLALLRPGGRLTFTVPAPGSLKELQRSWQQTGDAYQHINLFNSKQEWQAMGQIALQQLGLKAEWDVQQREFVRWFESPRAALQSLRGVGANRVTAGGRQGLTGKAQFKAMLHAYEAQRQTQGIPMTYQVLMGRIAL